MPIPKRLIKLIDSAKVKYEIIQHRTVYTAFDKAKTLKVPEKIIGKTLVAKMDRMFAIVLIPANKNLDKGKLKKAANAKLKKEGKKLIKKISLATENWMKKNLKGAKTGAVPPFGCLWKLPTFVDKNLTKNPKIIVSAGDYNYSFRISPAALKKSMPDIIMATLSQAKKK